MIKSVMFRLRVTRLNFPIIYYLFVLFFAVFGVVVVVFVVVVFQDMD